jgi:large subunit ribosomal protein L23
MGIFNKKTKDEKTDSKPVVKAEEKKVVAKKPEEKKATVKKAVKKTTAPKSAKAGYGTAYRILMRPVISEKATMANQENKYIFEVAIKANKIEIKKAIEEIYGVTPIAVNVMNQRGKFVRFGRKTGRTKDTKKAIVTLKKGDSITIYEGI